MVQHRHALSGSRTIRDGYIFRQEALQSPVGAIKRTADQNQTIDAKWYTYEKPEKHQKGMAIGRFLHGLAIQQNKNFVESSGGKNHILSTRKHDCRTFCTIFALPYHFRITILTAPLMLTLYDIRTGSTGLYTA